MKSKRINALGFMNLNIDSFYYPYYPVIKKVDSQVVFEAFNGFAERMADPKYSSGNPYTVVMVDNANIHPSKLLRDYVNFFIIRWSI